MVHTHSGYATGWAQARLPIPLYGTTHADHLAEDVPCTSVMSDEAVERDYEIETGNQILECFATRDPLATPMVLVAGHGAFTWGETPDKAIYNAAVLEELARMAFVTRTLNPAAARLPDRLIRKHFERKHGKNAYYGQSNEARQVAQIVAHRRGACGIAKWSHRWITIRAMRRGADRDRAAPSSASSLVRRASRPR